MGPPDEFDFGANRKEIGSLNEEPPPTGKIPKPGENTIRYYGYYSNLARGKRKKQDCDSAVRTIQEPLTSKKEFRRNWARFIQKI